MKHGHTAHPVSRTASAILVLLVGLTLSAGGAIAGLITGYAGSSGPGLGVVTFGSISTPSPSNDNVAGASPNTVVITEKRFDSFDAIWMEFDAVSDGIATVEYQFTETVTNNTGGIWIGYQLMLGMGTDSGWAHQPLGTGLDFDDPDDDSPRDFTPFTFLFYDEVTIDAGSGVVLPGESFTFTYAIDVPDNVTRFSIRASAREFTVPVEEGTWGSIKALYRTD